VIKSESSSLDHVVDTTRGAHHDMDTVLKGADVITDSGTTNAGMDADIHEVTEGHNHFHDLLGKLTGGCENQSLAIANGDIQSLKNANGEGGGFTSS
jgi:hypothetical protein